MYISHFLIKNILLHSTVCLYYFDMLAIKYKAIHNSLKKTRPFLVYFKRINKIVWFIIFDSKLVIAVKISRTRTLSFVQSIYNETCSTQIICLGFVYNNYLPFTVFFVLIGREYLRKSAYDRYYQFYCACLFSINKQESCENSWEGRQMMTS